MTPTQRLQIEQSEKRQKINDLLAVEDLKDERRNELDALTKRMQHLEVELRAALVVEGEPEIRDTQVDAEARERLALRARVQVTDYVSAAIEMRSAVGAAAEYNAALEIPANHFPMHC